MGMGKGNGDEEIEEELLNVYGNYLRIKDIVEHTNHAKVFKALFIQKHPQSLTATALRNHCDVRTVQRYKKRFLYELQTLRSNYDHSI